MGAAARNGRDKLTLVLPAKLEPFGLWVEQLIAESTGKNGHGIVPIAGEPPAAPGAYGSDRLFVRMRNQGDTDSDGLAAAVRDLRAARAPFAEIELPEPLALGAEFVRWEVATAVAGALLHVNPFDEPNVQQAKEATQMLLGRVESEGTLPVAAPHEALDATGITLTLTTAARGVLDRRHADAILTVLRKGDYLALLAFLGPDEALAAELQRLRIAARDRTRCATMVGYGPRYLHSTGQLHKGGPNTGVFIMITAAPAADLPIPGQRFSFGTLELAQALGDFASLEAAGRRALRVHLPSPDAGLLRQVSDRLLDRLRPL
jgi:hypothetical protein